MVVSDSGIQAAHMATAVMVFASHIGIDVNMEQNLMHIAFESLVDLPDKWELGVPNENEKNTGIPFFYHITTGESVWEHPDEENIMEKVKNERARLQKERKVKVVARKYPMPDAVKKSRSGSEDFHTSKSIEASDTKEKVIENIKLEMESLRMVDAVEEIENATSLDSLLPPNHVPKKSQGAGISECIFYERNEVAPPDQMISKVILRFCIVLN